MAKKKSHSASMAVRRLPEHLIFDLQEAEALTRRQRWTEARDLLVALDKRYEGQPDVLVALVNLYYDTHDMVHYLDAISRLVKIRPDDPDAYRGLAGAYLANLCPVLALQTFRSFLERWPDDPRAAEARIEVDKLVAGLDAYLADIGLAGEAGLELAALHEEARTLFEAGQHKRARQVNEEVLRRQPQHVAALNNISQLYWIEGRPDLAVLASQQVLSVEPENVHALSNLTRFLYLNGRPHDAQTIAERLKTVETDRPDAAVKIAEALSYLGDDQGVLAAVTRVERDKAHLPSQEDALLYHLAAAAAMRLGREPQARRYWEKALAQSPGFDLALDNLADLKRPVGERHGPWPYTLHYWLTPQTIKDVADQTERATRRRGDKAITRAMERYLRDHPAVASLVPVLLARGDPYARQFATGLAHMAQTPELLTALRDFALGQHGPDELRVQAGQTVAQAGLLPTQPVRMWLKGEWHELLMMGFEIHGEVLARHSPKVMRLMNEAIEARAQGDHATAVQLFEQAAALEPDQPDILNNLSAHLELAGRSAEAHAMGQAVHRRFPDYLFARVGMARLAVRDGKFDAARQLLEPLLTRTRLHFSEFAALCSAEIDLALAQGQQEGARSWLAIWEQADPDHPGIQSYREQLNPPGLLKRIMGQK